MQEEKIIISKEVYEKLVRDQNFLSCLENAGVDNWVGYSYAHEIFEEEYGEEYYNV